MKLRAEWHANECVIVILELFSLLARRTDSIISFLIADYSNFMGADIFFERRGVFLAMRSAWALE